jgi:GT2 family glycosyltransferase
MSRSRTAFVAPAPATAVTHGPVPTFSVVIPAYQAAARISEALASALRQTRPALEVIVCDDGSTDELEQALEPFRKRIVYLRQEHAGVGAARNLGLRSASADFVAVLDSDDIWLPRYLEALGELAAARPDLDLLSSDVYFDVGGEIVGRFYAENEFAVLDQRKAILRGCFVGWPASRRTRLLALGGFDESIVVSTDWEAWIRMILDGARAGLVPEPLMRYRLRRDSLTASRARSLQARVAVLDKTRRTAQLAPEEERTLEGSRQLFARRALVAEAREALAERRPGSRRRALALITKPGVPLRTRFSLLLSAGLRPGLEKARDERAPGEKAAALNPPE